MKILLLLSEKYNRHKHNEEDQKERINKMLTAMNYLIVPSLYCSIFQTTQITTNNKNNKELWNFSINGFSA